MIATLRGTVQKKALDRVIVDVGGVGYLVRLSVRSLADVPEVGEQVELLCHTHVREDALQLYGFIKENEQKAFEGLINVSGVGPKLALTILSGMPVDELVVAIVSGDSARLCTIPGVGKKTSERLILELKDRFAELVVVSEDITTKGDSHKHGKIAEVIGALVGLGYKRPLAERVVKSLVLEDKAAETSEELLRKALACINEA